ncbi:hypothetical protein [Bacillus toyonensis]|uniref:hypothetical protein n=1 Tax=Bacillus toyonensis TaxID=155322 RepID=UPI002E2325A6|nr:hypothetical protein [Bacillus toyonensis]
MENIYPWLDLHRSVLSIWNEKNGQMFELNLDNKEIEEIITATLERRLLHQEHPSNIDSRIVIKMFEEIYLNEFKFSILPLLNRNKYFEKEKMKYSETGFGVEVYLDKKEIRCALKYAKYYSKELFLDGCMKHFSYKLFDGDEIASYFTSDSIADKHLSELVFCIQSHFLTNCNLWKQQLELRKKLALSNLKISILEAIEQQMCNCSLGDNSRENKFKEFCLS